MIPSPINYSIHIIQFCEAVDKGKEIRAVFCDISKAFDRVWHKGLVYKLRCMGCSYRIVNWFASFFYLSVDNVFLLMVNHQTGSTFWLGSHKDRFLVLFYFSFTYMIYSITLDVLSACLLIIQVCISLWTVPFNRPFFLTLICKLYLTGLLLGLSLVIT